MNGKAVSETNHCNGNTNGVPNGFPNGMHTRNSSNGTAYSETALAFHDIRGNGDQMPIAQFEFWFSAIERDDADFIDRILDESSEEEKMVLMNGRFIFDCQPHFTSSFSMETEYCAFQRPLVLATLFRARKTIKVFLTQGADLFVQDIGSNTVLHGIIWAAAMKNVDNTNYVDLYDYVMSYLSSDQRRQLLYIENSEGLRPLELSARMCTFRIFQKILDTEGVYVFTRGRIGAHVCCWFDVTDYESFERGLRQDRSPLKVIVAMEKEHLPNAHYAHIVSHPAIKQWIQSKIAINVPYLVLWFLFRAAYTLLIFVVATADYSYNSMQFTMTHKPLVTNATDLPTLDKTCPKPLFFISKMTYNAAVFLVITVSLIIVVFDILDMIHYHVTAKSREQRILHAFGSRHFVVKTKFYRICNFLLASAVVIFNLSNIFQATAIALKAYIVANILNIWSLLFFIQLLPALGYFVTIIQRMLKDMFHFLVLYVILFFSFSQTFYNLFYINRACSEEFYSVPMSIYSTFRIMLNMIDLTAYDMKDITDVAILHIIYIIVVPILLVNFLIALMSNSVSDVANNRYLIMVLQRLTAALLVEQRLGRICRFLYLQQQRTRFVVKERRVYVECFIMKN